MKFFKNLSAQISSKSPLCVGLDTDLKKIPLILKAAVLKTYHYEVVNGKVDGQDTDELIIDIKAWSEVVSRFNEIVICRTSKYTPAYKINFAFYMRRALHGGMEALADAIMRIHDAGCLVILDFKEADIGNSSEMYAAAAFDEFGVDAVTVNPYLGFEDAIGPFLKYEDKGIYLLCHTSNKSALDTQEVNVFNSDEKIGSKPYYLHIAALAKLHNKFGNLGLVMGATYPKQILPVRAEVGDDMHLLLPAIGAQGGPFEEALTNAGQNKIFNVSRDIIYTSNEEGFGSEIEKKASFYAEAANKIGGGLI